MFDRIFADYLIEMGKLSEQNVEVIFSTKEERRARLGVIAVSEGVGFIGCFFAFLFEYERHSYTECISEIVKRIRHYCKAA